MQTFTAPLNTNYKLEVWGAQGGGWNISDGYHDLGGKGGYSIGYKNLSISNNLYVCVGSKGNGNSGVTGGNGGYNGGGKGGNGYDVYTGAGGGGGATHLVIMSNRGELKNYKDYYQSELLLVAGGGGGCGFGRIGGFGGGLNGGDAISQGDNVISGATQTSGYAFGQGQDGKTKTIFGSGGAQGNGGGGGGFYGGPASQQEGEKSCCPGTGGSGYINTTLITNGATIAGDQTFPSPNGGTETGHEGNGYCIITWQQLP